MHEETPWVGNPETDVESWEFTVHRTTKEKFEQNSSSKIYLFSGDKRSSAVAPGMSGNDQDWALRALGRLAKAYWIYIPPR